MAYKKKTDILPLSMFYPKRFQGTLSRGGRTIHSPRSLAEGSSQSPFWRKLFPIAKPKFTWGARHTHWQARSWSWSLDRFERDTHSLVPLLKGSLFLSIGVMRLLGRAYQ
mgnify:CR=1 FL=1